MRSISAIFWFWFVPYFQSTPDSKGFVITAALAEHLRIDITKTRLFKYMNTLQPRKEHFQIKISDIFYISPQNIDCGYTLEPPRHEYLQSMLLSRNKKK